MNTNEFLHKTIENYSLATATADNAVATATQAASAGNTHVSVFITAGYDVAAIGTLTIKDGTTTLLVLPVHSFLAEPIILKATAGALISAALSASGTAGKSGYVSLKTIKL